MLPYRVVTVDLTVAHDRLELIAANTQVEQVTILDNPSGLGCALAFGPGEMIPLQVQGQFFDCCPAEYEGIYFQNPAGAGSLRILVSFLTGLTAGGN